jgi:hypothetical protein
MFTDAEVAVPFRSRSRLWDFHERAKFRLSCSFSTIGNILTSDTDDECLPDWPSILSIPCNVEKRRAMTMWIQMKRWAEDLATVASKRREMYMAGVRETSKVGS